MNNQRRIVDGLVALAALATYFLIAQYPPSLVHSRAFFFAYGIAAAAMLLFLFMNLINRIAPHILTVVGDLKTLLPTRVLVVGLLAITLLFATSLTRHERLRMESRRASLRRDTQFVSIEHRPKPQSRLAGFYPAASSIYALSIDCPHSVYLDEDFEITLKNIRLSHSLIDYLGQILNPDDLGGGDPMADFDASVNIQSIQAGLSLSSNSFSIRPEEELRFPLVGGGSAVRFLVRPIQIGRRRILVRSRMDLSSFPELSALEVYDHVTQSLEIEVYEPPIFFGLTSTQLETISRVSGAIGFPAMALFFLNLARTSRYLEEQTAGKGQRGKKKRTRGRQK